MQNSPSAQALAQHPPVSFHDTQLTTLTPSPAGTVAITSPLKTSHANTDAWLVRCLLSMSAASLPLRTTESPLAKTDRIRSDLFKYCDCPYFSAWSSSPPKALSSFPSVRSNIRMRPSRLETSIALPSAEQRTLVTGCAITSTVARPMRRS